MSAHDDPDGWIERIEELRDAADVEGAWKLLRKARRRWPDDGPLQALEGALWWDGGELEQALAAFDRALELDPDDAYGRRDRATLLLDLGRPADALRELDLIEVAPEDLDESAAGWFDRGRALDQLGRPDEADACFRRAAALRPVHHPLPPRLSDADFRVVVEAALDEIPERFDRLLRDVVVSVHDYPGPTEADATLLGVYVGVPLTERDHDHVGLDEIRIFKRNLELAFPDPTELADEIGKTVIHEIAHFFGLEHEDMGDFL